jgi:isoprenylcysteine carboxyl methyltransferase (ICMT) family protein YpbQ
VKHHFEIILAVNVLFLFYAIYCWLQIEKFKWDEHNSAIYFIITGALLAISTFDNYWNVKIKRAQNQLEEL